MARCFMSYIRAAEFLQGPHFCTLYPIISDYDCDVGNLDKSGIAIGVSVTGRKWGYTVKNSFLQSQRSNVQLVNLDLETSTCGSMAISTHSSLSNTNFRYRSQPSFQLSSGPSHLAKASFLLQPNIRINTSSYPENCSSIPVMHAIITMESAP